MSWPVETTTTSADATRALAGRVAPLCRAGDVVLLEGELGAGKTVFAQGFATALGVTGPVTSPTFALVRHYRCHPPHPVSTLIHADVYRTGSLAEVVDLGLAELVEEDAVALVEWGNLAAPALGEHALVVTLRLPDAVASPGLRTISVSGRGRWAGRAGEITAACEHALGPGAGRR
jgi:tRNA threonylcarbamoyladenosine biosynthesis protein TsaE